MDKKIIKDNFTEVDSGKFITTERERESCYAVTTRPRSRPLSKKQDNYVLEKKDDDSEMDKEYRIRKLTPVECERLQGFPDDWTKYGKDGELISDTQRYKCCGNAVTTTVITAIIDEMFN